MPCKVPARQPSCQDHIKRERLFPTFSSKIGFDKLHRRHKIHTPPRALVGHYSDDKIPRAVMLAVCGGGMPHQQAAIGQVSPMRPATGAPEFGPRRWQSVFMVILGPAPSRRP